MFFGFWVELLQIAPGDLADYVFAPLQLMINGSQDQGVILSGIPTKLFLIR